MPLTGPTGDAHLESTPVLSVNAISRRQETFSRKSRAFEHSCSFLTLCSPLPHSHSGGIKEVREAPTAGSFDKRPGEPVGEASAALGVQASASVGARSEPRAPFSPRGCGLTARSATHAFGMFSELCPHHFSFRNPSPCAACTGPRSPGAL